ncbi:MAG: phosphotransferase [Anaerolineales bacterium]|nr:phosphotransferase [Anaerolineales bacterium]
MTRQEALDCFYTHGLADAARLYRISPEDLTIYPDSVGCQNLVFAFRRDAREMLLRASFRPDRPIEQMEEEIHFIDHLADGGMRVSRAVPSESGNLVEQVQAGAQIFVLVAFEKAPGMRMPDNGYRYREGGTAAEYSQNWGGALGKMHALTKGYIPLRPDVRRPTWLEMRPAGEVDRIIPEEMPLVREKFKALLAEVRQLPTPANAYGLVHADFNDGNFCIDYSNGDITVFDFDDSCYGWFMKELADAWDGFVGWCARKPDPQQRRDSMQRSMDGVMLGYSRENSLDPAWLDRLPFFLKVIEMEALMCRLGYALDNNIPLEEEGAVNYLVRCIEEDIPYLGLYDPIFSPEQPFSLD